MNANMRDRFTAALVALMLALSLAAPVAAGPFEDGRAAYDRGDYAHALRLWRPLADQGDTAAQFFLGSTYGAGEGVPQDYTEALKWLRRAADPDDAEGSQSLAVTAQLFLGRMYAAGQGVPQDYTEATKWFRRAADQGNAEAQLFLGRMYAAGQGVPQDYTEALKWLRRAADQDDAGAQFALGVMYAAGGGVPQDYVQAHKWYNLAASRFPASDAEQRGKAADARERLAAKMTPAQIAEAQKLAREWKPK